MHTLLRRLLRNLQAHPPYPKLSAQSPAIDEGERIRHLERQLLTQRDEFTRAQADERERVACRLHDDIGQLIALIRIKLDLLVKRSPSAWGRVLGELVERVDEAAEAIRTLTHELGANLVAPPLLPELERMTQELRRRSSLQVDLDVQHSDLHLPEPQRAVVCRAVRELCFNVLKHANARRIAIELRVKGGRLWIEVQDDGQGLPAPAPRTWRVNPHGGFGLASAQAQLRALGGDLQLQSRPGRGTRARVTVPLNTH